MGLSYRALVASVGLTVLIGGCGGGGSSSVISTVTGLTVVDSYIMFATVFDANGTKIAITNEHGKVEITKQFTYPLYASGGVFDVNGNAQVDENDYLVPSGVKFSASAGDVISPVTTFITLGADSEKLAQLLGVSEVELLGDAIELNNTELAKAYQMLYAVMVFGASEHVIEAINTTNQKLAEASSDGLATLIVSTNLDNADLIDFVNTVSNIHFETPAGDVEGEISGGKADISGSVSPDSGYVPEPCDDIIIVDMSECSDRVTPPFPAASQRGTLPPIDGIDACYDYQHAACCTIFPQLCSSASSSSSMPSSSSSSSDGGSQLPPEDGGTSSSSSSSDEYCDISGGTGCSSSSAPSSFSSTPTISSSSSSSSTGQVTPPIDGGTSSSSSSSVDLCELGISGADCPSQEEECLASGGTWDNDFGYCYMPTSSSLSSSSSSSSSSGGTLPPV